MRSRRVRLIVALFFLFTTGLWLWNRGIWNTELRIPDVTKPWSARAVRITDTRPFLDRLKFWRKSSLNIKIYHQIDGEPELRFFYRHLPSDENPRVIGDLSRGKEMFWYQEPKFPGGSVRVEYDPKGAKSGFLYAEITRDYP